MKHKVSKNLFIGLGGTGSSTLIQVKRAVMQKYGQIPPVIDFLIIDTDEDVGTGRDVTIAELATMMARIVGFEGDIEFDTSKLDGAPRKLLDVNLARSLGWESSVELEIGLGMTYKWFLEHLHELRS